MLWVLTLLLAVVGGQGAGVCDNVKCANKNGRCCANVGGRGVCVDAQEAFAWTTTLWAETFHRMSDVPRRTGAVVRRRNGRGVCMDCTVKTVGTSFEQQPSGKLCIPLSVNHLWKAG
jgi:hypothetical protein